MDSVAHARTCWTEFRARTHGKNSLQQNHGQYFDGHAGLTGGSERVHIQIAATPTAATPPKTTGVELMIPPPAAVAAPAPLRRLFFFFSGFVVSSRVVCCPCVTVVVPLSSCTVRSPLLAAICTRPSTSVT